MELCYCPGLQSSRAPTLDLIFQASSTLFCCCWGCSLCASPPLLEKKTCMISYMKDICNWTVGPMQYIYNSKQHTLKPASTFSPPFFLRKCIWTHQKREIRKQTKHRLPFVVHARDGVLSVCGSGSCLAALIETEHIWSSFAMLLLNRCLLRQSQQ